MRHFIKNVLRIFYFVKSALIVTNAIHVLLIIFLSMTIKRNALVLKILTLKNII